MSTKKIDKRGEGIWSDVDKCDRWGDVYYNNFRCSFSKYRWIDVDVRKRRGRYSHMKAKQTREPKIKKVEFLQTFFMGSPLL